MFCINLSTDDHDVETVDSPAKMLGITKSTESISTFWQILIEHGSPSHRLDYGFHKLVWNYNMTTMEYSHTLIIWLTLLMYFLFPYRLSYNNEHVSEPRNVPLPSAVEVSLSIRITETIRDQGEVHCQNYFIRWLSAIYSN